MAPLPAPTTTLTKETSVNTSAAANYCSLVQPVYGGSPRQKIGTHSGCPDSNKNEIGNVSRRNIRELLYPGSTTKIYFHHMPWFPHTSFQAGYVSNDINQVKKQIQDAVERGGQGFMIDYYYTKYDAVCLKIRDECNRRKDFEFCMDVDSGIIKDLAVGTKQAKLIEVCNYVATTYYPSTQYIKWNGRPLLLFFGTSAFNDELDWNAIRAAIKGNPLLIFRNSGGFAGSDSDGVSDGAYSWTGPESTYIKAKSYPTKLCIASAAKGFYDDMASWGDAKYTLQNNALFWKSQYDLINKYFSSSFQLPMLQMVTWNDWEEGTEIESGVDNHIAVGVSLAGDVLTWSVTGGSGETMVAQYKLFMSVDGENLSLVKTFKTGITSFDLSTLNLDAAAYKIRVQAEGKPCVFNHTSSELAWTSAAAPWPTPPPPADQSSVSAETGVNTSASPQYRADSPDPNIQANFSGISAKSDLGFNPRAGNVSKEQPNLLLPALGVGYEGTRIIVSTEDWWGGGVTGHIANGYVSNTVAQMEAMVQDAKASGYHVLCPTWYGGTDGVSNHVAINAAALKLRDACVKFGMKMCLMAGLNIWRGATKDDKATNFNLDMDYAFANFFQSPAYEKFAGRPVFFLFSEDQVLLNTDTTQWNTILTHIAAACGNPRLLSRNSSAVSKMYASGVFGWPSTCDPDSAVFPKAYFDFFYSQVSANAPSDWPIVGAAFPGFYDKLAGWKFNCASGAERFINRRQGQTWLDSWKAMATWFGTGKRKLDYMMVATWNDYEEGTETELGIDAGFTVQATINASQALTWSINGNINALSKAKVWLSIDNNNLDLLQFQSTPNGSIPIADLALPPGTYEFYVQAYGKNRIQNVLSAPVPYVVLPPVVNPPPPEPVLDPARIICERYRQRHRQAENPTFTAQS